MRSGVRPGTAIVVAGCATALSAAACGGPSPTPTGSAPATSSASPSVALSGALLDTNDFQAGASARSPTGVPDLTSIKCSPNQATGLQYQYKSEIQAASGRVYGNVVVGFDTAADAHGFVTQFFSGAQSCSDASSPPVQDTSGTYSFYFAITASPNNLDVEAVQVDRYVSVIIQYLPAGVASDPLGVRNLTAESATKLQAVTA